ncbi:unnamed protein product [Heligmosomoides polygyrus]|uniref:Inhibitor_I29 domain-containing protein n=1 Tax=Heligmosomoides polygyrus TaxID=6339 RepID=A0A183F6T4_HELPZ|nr:unnamed protein product [Heligmosomoides polygyrus]
MFALSAALGFILVNVFAQDEYCTLKHSYREFYQKFHHAVNSGLIWSLALEDEAKLEATHPGNRANNGSLYIKIEKQKKFLKEDQRHLIRKVYDVIQLSKEDLAKVKTLPHGSYVGRNGLYDTDGVDADNLKVVCLYRQSS